MSKREPPVVLVKTWVSLMNSSESEDEYNIGWKMSIEKYKPFLVTDLLFALAMSLLCTGLLTLDSVQDWIGEYWIRGIFYLSPLISFPAAMFASRDSRHRVSELNASGIDENK